MSTPIRIIFFGDSICCGEGVSVHRGWVPKISEFFENKYGSAVVIHNSSVNGETTRTALVHMGYSVMSRDFDIMVVQFGMNDCNRWKTERNCNRVSVGSFESNLNEIINRGFVSGIKKIFLMTNHTAGRPGYREELSDYNDVIRRVAGEHKHMGTVLFIEIERVLTRDYLAVDGIHLTASGNEQYSHIARPPIEAAVEELLKCK